MGYASLLSRPVYFTSSVSQETLQTSLEKMSLTNLRGAGHWLQGRGIDCRVRVVDCGVRGVHYEVHCGVRSLWGAGR